MSFKVYSNTVSFQYRRPSISQLEDIPDEVLCTECLGYGDIIVPGHFYLNSTGFGTHSLADCELCCGTGRRGIPMTELYKE